MDGVFGIRSKFHYFLLYILVSEVQSLPLSSLSTKNHILYPTKSHFLSGLVNCVLKWRHYAQSRSHCSLTWTPKSVCRFLFLVYLGLWLEYFHVLGCFTLSAGNRVAHSQISVTNPTFLSLAVPWMEFDSGVYDGWFWADRTCGQRSLYWCEVQLKCDGTRWRTVGEVKGKMANALGSQYPSHYLGTRCIQHYYRWCRGSEGETSECIG